LRKVARRAVARIIDDPDHPRYDPAMRISAVLVMVVLAVSGCASTGGVPAGGTSFTWVTGRLEGSLPAQLPQVEAAVREAFEELRFVAVDGENEGLKAKLRARMPDGSKVSVRLRAEDFANTTVTVRVGTLGDRAISEQIYKHIERALDG
jgi:8-oxo-dGTP pyrophosphatase MutT (NUDIX family)